MNSKALGIIKDDLARFEQARKDADTVPTIVNEDGSIEKWSIDGDIEKVKRDLDSDIAGLNELIITFQTAVDEDWEIIKEKYNEIPYSVYMSLHIIFNDGKTFFCYYMLYNAIYYYIMDTCNVVGNFSNK